MCTYTENLFVTYHLHSTLILNPHILNPHTLNLYPSQYLKVLLQPLASCAKEKIVSCSLTLHPHTSTPSHTHPIPYIPSHLHTLTYTPHPLHILTPPHPHIHTPSLTHPHIPHTVRIYHRRGARRWKKIRRINGHAFVAKRFQVCGLL